MQQRQEEDSEQFAGRLRHDKSVGAFSALVITSSWLGTMCDRANCDTKRDAAREAVDCVEQNSI